MANKPLAYVLSERKANFGKLAGKTVIQARPTGRKRVDHRSFCDEVGRATTFTGAEVEAVVKGQERFNPNVHITKPIVRLSPSRKYFTLTGVTYERVEVSAKKKKTTKPSGGDGTENP